MAWTSLLPWAVGEKIRAAKLTAAVTAIGELQTCATSVTYDQTVTTGPALTWASNAAVQPFPASSFPSASGFTGGSSIGLPSAGAYQVTMIMKLSGGTWAAATRYYSEIWNGGATAIARATAVPGISEDILCVSAVTGLMNAGNFIIPQRFQNTGSSLTLASVRMIVTRIPAQ